jgi:hypothetical protein
MPHPTRFARLLWGLWALLIALGFLVLMLK